MTVPTQPVTMQLADFGGPSIAGVTVRIIPTKIDYTEDGTFVSTKEIKAVSDASGTVVWQSFPCALVANGGLGTTGSTIRVVASLPGSRSIDVQAATPNAPCNLVDYLVDQEPNGLGASERAASDAEAARDLSEQWATKTTAPVDGVEFSSKEYAHGTQGGTGGSAKSWASGPGLIDGVDKSAKGYAQDAGADANQTALDRTQTGLDRTQTGLDRTQTGLDRTQTGLDRAQTGLDVVAADAAKLAAQTANTDAQLAKTIVINSNGTFASQAAGHAATTSGKVFFVTTADPQQYTVYQNTGAGDTLLGTLAIADARVLNSNFSSDYVYYVHNEFGMVVFGIKDDGTVEFGESTISKINGTSMANISGVASLVPTTDLSDYLWYLQDSVGNIAFAMLSTGAMQVADLTATALTATTATVTNLTVTNINGQTASDFVTNATIRDNGNYPAEICFVNNTGQSLGEGSSPSVNITTVQEYDSVGFAAGDSNPAAFLPLTTGNTSEGPGTRGENPMYGFCGFLKELIQKEEGVLYTQHSFQLCAASNALGGANIAGIAKGTTEYNCAEAQVAKGYTLAQAAGKTFKHICNLFTQGESNGTTPRATYKTALQQLVTDYNTDSNAAVPNNGTVLTISYQVSTDPTSESNVALAMFDVHDAVPTLFRIATPIYWMQPEWDGTHISAVQEKWLGAYYALVYKRVVIDNFGWEPLRIDTIIRQGNLLLVKYKVPKRRDGKRTPLVFDTTTIAAVTNSGYTLVDGSGVAQTINSVSIVEGDTLKIVAASTISAGWKLRYAMNNVNIPSINTGAYLRGAGNLRDSYGDYLKYDGHGSRAMHNWACIEEKTIS